VRYGEGSIGGGCEFNRQQGSVVPFLFLWVKAMLAGIDEGYDAAEAVVMRNRWLFFLAFGAGIAVILVGNALAGFP
jgi:hypothetical protein